MPNRVRARRPSTGRRLIIAVVVLLGLLVAADRIGVLVADDAAATTLQRSQHLQDRPDVSIGGFPFLTQLATGNFDHVHVTARNVLVGQGSSRLRIAHLDVTLRHVHVARDFSRATSQFSTATALIAYPDLSKALGATFGYGGDGRVRASASAGVVPGLSMSGTATAGVAVRGESLAFTDPQVAVAGQQVPPALADYFAGLLQKSISLAGLPFGVHVRSVRASSAGVTITLTASGLTYAR